MTATLAPCITVGAGRDRPIGRACPDVASVADLAAALAPLTQHEAWWAGSTFLDDRRSTDRWQSGHVIGTDLDYHDADGSSAELPDDVFSAARELLLPVVSALHRTPHGLRVVHLLDAPTADRAAFASASRGAAAIVASALRTLPQLAVDPACVADLARMFYGPCAHAKGVQRRAEIIVGARDLWSIGDLVAHDPGDKIALLPAVGEPDGDAELRRRIATEVARQDGDGSEFATAVARFCRDHTPAAGWGRPGKGTCPVCGHHDCFGAVPQMPDRWCCFSASHGDVGLPLAGGQGRHGDALDLEVHRRGLPPGPASRAAVLREGGYLPATRARAIEVAGEPRHSVPPPTVVPYESPPVDALPLPARALVEHAARSIDCDPGFALPPVLACMSAAIGGTRELLLRPGQTESALLWCAVVGESGAGKTPALSFASAPIRELESVARRQWRAAREAYEHELSEWTRAREGRGPRPEPPAEPRWFAADVTIERVASMLAGSPRGFLVLRDELAGWLDFDRYSGGRRGGEQAAWLSIHSGQTLAVDRKADHVRILVDRPFVAVAGGIQLGVLRRIVAAGPELLDSGLLGRVLLAAPPSRPRHWHDDGVPDHVRRAWSAFIGELARLSGTDTGDGVHPVTVGMSGPARAVWVEWFERAQHEREQAESPAERAAWSKIETAAARLALVVHVGRMIEDATLRPTVDADSMRAGVRLAEWFGREARRLYGILASAQVDSLSQLLERVRQFAAAHGRGPTPRDWARRTQRGARDTTAAEVELETLVRAGLAEWHADDDRPGPRARRLVLLAPVSRSDTFPTSRESREIAVIRGIRGTGDSRDAPRTEAPRPIPLPAVTDGELADALGGHL